MENTVFVRRWQMLNHLVIWSTSVTSIFFTLLLIIAKYPDYWEWINTEQTPMTWYQSILLFAIAIFALINAGMSYLQFNCKQFTVWFFFGVSFLFLMLDERFTFHELVRDRILKPSGVKIPFLPWVGPGDFILLFYLVAALALLPWIYQILKERLSASIFFIVGFTLGSSAIIADSFDFYKMSHRVLIMEQFLEEIVETLAFTSVLIGVALMTLWYIRVIFLFRSDRE